MTKQVNGTVLSVCSVNNIILIVIIMFSYNISICANFKVKVCNLTVQSLQ